MGGRGRRGAGRERVADLCAAPGGKATRLAATGAAVVAADVRESRVRSWSRTSSALESARASSSRPTRGARRFAPASFDRVLVDAPCSGLGALRRRPDARWRIDADAVARLAALQRELVDAAVAARRARAAVLVYTVCTLTAAETLGVDEHLADRAPRTSSRSPRRARRGAARARWRCCCPKTADTDGMFVLRLRRG